jgi:O-acetyl-ADP-ribose deacetylase (regulator of RNase III)
MKINYVTGDATAPIGEGRKLIIHVCNDMGGWGSGFVLAVSRRWKEPEEQYRSLAENNLLRLGNVQFVHVDDNITVGNMIGQHKTHWIDGVPPVRYEAIAQALDSVASYAIMGGYTVHAPRFGSALAGGSWEIIEELINKHLIMRYVPVTIYDFPEAESFQDEIDNRRGE